MAVAVYTSDLTVMTPEDPGSTGNFAAIGGGQAGLNVETDYFIQGVNCISKNAFANSARGIIEDTTNTALNVGDLSGMYMWLTHATPGSLATKSNGGIAVLAGSSASNLNRYNYAGVDTIDYGAPWICAIVDPENATASSGTVLPVNMNTYGVETNMVGGPTKGSPLGLDAIRQGRSYDITEGDVVTPATFQEAANENDLQANRFGQFQGVKGGFSMQCRLGFGTAGTACYFEDSNVSITLEDLEFVSSDFIEFEVLNAGSTVILNNVTITALGTNTRGNFNVTNSLLVQLSNCNFIGMGVFSLDGNSTLTNVLFRSCDQITGGSLTNCTVETSINTSAVAYANLSSITGCNFIGDGTGHAVEITGTIAVDETMVWDNTFDTNTYALVDGASGNETILCNVDSGVTLTISVSDTGTAPTIMNAGLGTVTVVVGQVTTKVIVLDGTLVPPVAISTLDANVLVEADVGGDLAAGTDIIKGFTDINGEIEDIRSFTSDQPVRGWVRKSSSSPFFRQSSISATISSANGLSLTILLQSDE